MKTKLITLLMLLSIGAAAQNYVTNGYDWIDIDPEDGVGDTWTIGPYVDPQIDSGWQYCAGSLVELNQDLYIPASDKTYIFECDIRGNVPVYVHIQTGILSGVIAEYDGTGQAHLMGQFLNPHGIYRIRFLTTSYGWMAVDNVELYEVWPVGISETGIPVSEPEYFDILGNRITEPKGLYLKKVGNRVTKHYKP